MGQCGCGDFMPDFKFKGPGDHWYVLQSYPGCGYCDTPAGVIIYRFNPEEARQWCLKDIKEVEIPMGGYCVPIIHKEKLKKRIFTHLAETAEFSAEAIVDECFRAAVHDSMRED